MTINFTREHMAKLVDLAAQALFKGTTFKTKMGQVLNIFELVHTISINQLNEIKTNFTNKINNLESKDEWVEVDTTELDALKESKELVNLIIGWKRFQLEKAENERKRIELSAKLTELKESQKTPEDRIKEMEAELAALDAEDF